MKLINKLCSSAEAGQHEYVRQAALCKRRGFDSVVRYTFRVYDWLTVWTVCRNKFQELIIFASQAYLIEEAITCWVIRLECFHTISFNFLNGKILL